MEPAMDPSLYFITQIKILIGNQELKQIQNLTKFLIKSFTEKIRPLFN